MEEPKSKKNGALTAIAATTTIGTEMAITVMLGFYGGKYMDNWFGTEPLFLVAGILIGIGLGIFGIIYTMQRFFQN